MTLPVPCLEWGSLDIMFFNVILPSRTQLKPHGSFLLVLWDHDEDTIVCFCLGL